MKVKPVRLFSVRYFSMGFSRLVGFDGAAAILVCKSERDLGRMPILSRGAGVGISCSLETLPRSRLRLQTKMAAAPSKCTSLENPMEK